VPNKITPDKAPADLTGIPTNQADFGADAKPVTTPDTFVPNTGFGSQTNQSTPDTFMPNTGFGAGDMSLSPIIGKPTPQPNKKTSIKTKQKPDPKVLALQKELQKRGYPIKADGIMGPKTEQARQWAVSSGDINRGLQGVIGDTTPPTPRTAPSYDMKASDMQNIKAETASSAIREHVSFGQDQELARIISLSRR
jgi:hypothetical protein